jgi:hypothetical protein
MVIDCSPLQWLRALIPLYPSAGRAPERRSPCRYLAPLLLLDHLLTTALPACPPPHTTEPLTTPWCSRRTHLLQPPHLLTLWQALIGPSQRRIASQALLMRGKCTLLPHCRRLRERCLRGRSPSHMRRDKPWPHLSYRKVFYIGGCRKIHRIGSEMTQGGKGKILCSFSLLFFYHRCFYVSTAAVCVRFI